MKKTFSKKSVPKVVLDTNILISSIFWSKGATHEVVLSAIESRIINFTSSTLLKELFSVLQRKFQQPEEYILRQVALVMSYSKIVSPQEQFSLVRDKDDNAIIECAYAAKAEWIITGDLDLLELKTVKNIKTITAKEFVKKVINRN